MQFKNGWLGACLVVIALLATVLLGFTLNINEGTATALKYEPITNVTGQFQGDSVPDYIEYSNAKNYTGYTPGTISFTPSHVANQYTVIVDPGNNTDLGTVTPSSQGIDIINNDNYIKASGGLWLRGGFQMTVADFLTRHNIDYTQFDYIKLDFMGGVTPRLEDGYYFVDQLITASKESKSNFTDYFYGDSYYYATGNGTGGVIPYSHIWYANDPVYIPYSTDLNNLANYLIVYTDGSVNYYRSGTDIYDDEGNTITVTDQLVFSADVGSAYIDGFTQAGSISLRAGATPYTPWPDTVIYPPMVDFRNYLHDNIPTYYTKINGVDSVVYDYMRISDGVTLIGPSEWTNGRQNGVIDWVIRFNAGDSINITPSWDGNTNGTVALSYNGALIASVVGQAYNGGGWDTWHISIDALNGTVALTPVTTFNTFQNYVLSASPKVFNVPAFANPGITSVELSVTGSPNFSVTRTMVNYDISKTSIVNGSMDPRVYFPASDYGQLMIRFDSFAVYGDGITLNGVTYPVQDRSVTIGAYKLQLNGLAVVYNSDGTMSAEYDKTSVSLGEIVDNTITFNGVWYFTARALNGFYTDVSTVDWNIGTWATTFNQTIVLYEAILLIGGLVARHYQKIKALDWVIIIFAMVGGAVLV